VAMVMEALVIGVGTLDSDNIALPASTTPSADILERYSSYRHGVTEEMAPVEMYSSHSMDAQLFVTSSTATNPPASAR
jgi:hypothetical protein